MARSILLYLYSSRNILGSLLALIGVLLFFAGALPGAWALVIPALYLVGAALDPLLSRRPRGEPPVESEKSLEEIEAELERLVVQARRALPLELAERVSSIKGSIVSVLPTLASYSEGDQNLYNIRQTALEYLPEALRNYMRLPTAYANFHPVQEGKTARQLLAEQLAILDREMKEVAEDIARDDTQKLLIHGRFLADKFQSESLLVRR